MLGIVKKLKALKDLVRPRSRLGIFRDTPVLFRTHFRYSLRRALLDEFVLPMWVTTRSGTKFYLSRDTLDDRVAKDLIDQPEMFFPDLEGLSPPEGCVVDIGGHHGLYAAEALKRYPKRDLIVVEPHPEWCRLISKHARQNDRHGRTRIENSCLAADNKKRTLRFDLVGSWGATTFPLPEANVAVEVASLTLPEILGTSKPVLIYCNAEGAEYSLVQQMQQSGTVPPRLVIMVHPEYGDASALHRGLIMMGYSVRNVGTHPERPILHATLSEPNRLCR